MNSIQLDLLRDPPPPTPESYGLESDWLSKTLRTQGHAKCPVCEHTHRVYVRPISGEMARTLIMVYRHYFKYPYTKPVHIDHMLAILKPRPKGNNHGLLVHWELLKKVENVDLKKKDSGHYTLTPKGMRFVKGEVSVLSHALVYRDQCYGFEGEEVSIRDCLGRRFDYEKLMNGEW